MHELHEYMRSNTSLRSSTPSLSLLFIKRRQAYVIPWPDLTAYETVCRNIVRFDAVILILGLAPPSRLAQQPCCSSVIV